MVHCVCVRVSERGGIDGGAIKVCWSNDVWSVCWGWEGGEMWCQGVVGGWW